MKTVGVLGGMGPAATVDFFARIVAATPATRDQDHLRLIIDNNPKVPDRNAALSDTGPSPAEPMSAMARGLERAGADLLVIACNTAHAFIGAVRKSVAIPVLDMVEETALAVRQAFPTGGKVGLLAADGCLSAGLYQSALERQGIAAIALDPVGQACFMDLLYRLKAGSPRDELAEEMTRLSLGLEERGAELLVAACTEVPLLLSAADYPGTLLNSTDVLVTATIREAAGACWPASGGASESRSR